MLARKRAEKAEEAALRADPLGTAVDSKQESLARLQALRQQQQQYMAKSTPAAKRAAEQQLGQEGEPAAAGAASTAIDDDEPSTTGRHEEAGAAAEEEQPGGGGAANGELPDPYAGMTAKQRKLHEIKQKMKQARKANEDATIADKKRQRVSDIVQAATC
jgi:hypothetical protein